MTTTQIKQLVQGIYEARRDRQVNPEGHFDGAGRWYPTDREDAGVTRTLRSPSRAWPYSYMVGCRTRKHVAALVTAALAGHDVPVDVSRALAVAGPSDLRATVETPAIPMAALVQAVG